MLTIVVAGCNAAFGVDDLSYVDHHGQGGAGGVADGCANGSQDGDETDIDCGGSCEPCAVGHRCDENADCATALCDVDGLCLACSNHLECPLDWFCDTKTGVCLHGLPNGESCNASEDCASGFCPPADGVCCDTPCSLTCEACLGSKTGAEDGICDYVNPALEDDPDEECPVESPNTCGSTGAGCSGIATACIVFDETTVCQPGGCTNGMETPLGFCDGEGSCPTVTPTPCSPYVCGMTACLTSCSAHDDCVSTHYCNNVTCTYKISSGGACTSSAQCVSGVCTGGFCS